MNVLGVGASTNSLEEFENADAEVLILTGSNTTEAHPIIGNKIKKGVKRGMKLIVVDPRKIELVDFAVLHLQIRVGTDIAVYNAMAKVIMDEELYDQAFIERTTTGFDKLKEFLAPYTLEYAQRVSGVPAEKIRDAAHLYAKANTASIAWTLGITEHKYGVDNVYALTNLCLLTGNLGKKGSGLNPLRGQNNVQGGGDMGCLPHVFPGLQKVDDPKTLDKFEKRWGKKLNSVPGYNLTQMIEAMLNRELKALFVIGENPIRSDIDMSHTRKAFEQLEFLVVQEIFLTETTDYADVVLPAASWAESDGTYTNSDRHVQRVRKLIQPFGNVKEDWQILCELAARMGYSMNYNSAEEIWNEVRELVDWNYGGMSYARLEEKGLQYPCPTLDHPGTKILHTRFQDPVFTGRPAPFTLVQHQEPEELPDDEYPFILTTGRRRENYNTGNMTGRYARDGVPRQSYETCDINPLDGKRLGVVSGDWLRVSSRRGEVKVKAKITDMVPPGTVFMSFHWSDVPTNLLTIHAVDPKAGTGEYKACAVQIEKI